MARAFHLVFAAALMAAPWSLAAEPRPAIAAEAAVLPPAGGQPGHAAARDELRMAIEGEDVPASPAVSLTGKTKGSGPQILEVAELQQINALCARAPNWQQYTICHRVRPYKAPHPAAGQGGTGEQY